MSFLLTKAACVPRGIKLVSWPILVFVSCVLALAGPVAADSLLPAEGQLLYRVHVQFEWPPVRAAERYQLQIVEDDGSRDPFESAAPAVDLDLDAARPRAVVTEGLQFGAAYAWRVRGVVEGDGNRDPFEGAAPAVDLVLGAARWRAVVTEGLQFGAAYTWRMRGARGVPGVWSATHRFATAPLPAALPPISTTISGAGPVEPGLTIVEIAHRTLIEGRISVAIDASGEVVWFRESPGQMADVRLLPSGRLLYLMGQRAYETTLDGRITWASPEGSDFILHHEVFPMPSGNFLTLTRAFAEVSRDGELQVWEGSHIIELDRHTNEVVWEWNPFDHFSTLDFDAPQMEEPGVGRRFPDAYDWLHSNAVVYNPDDNSVYVSVRHLNRITRIDYATGEIVYNMGFYLPSGDTLFGDDLFSFQHSPELQPNGNLLLFDNGNRRHHRIPPPATAVSKAVELAFNGNPPTSAQIVFEYTLPFYSMVQGDADRMPNGNTLIAISTRGILTEVDANGTEVWRLELPQAPPRYTIYRTERIPELVVDAPADSDGDGLVDDIDNCPDHRNTRQFDCDCDGMGDVCAVALGLQGECVPGCAPPLSELVLPEAAAAGIARAQGTR